MTHRSRPRPQHLRAVPRSAPRSPWFSLGAPNTEPFPGPATQPATPSSDPHAGEACTTASGKAGILASDKSAGGALVCAVSADKAADGEVCVVPGTTAFVPIAGVMYNLGPGLRYCVDESQMDTAFYDACTKTLLSDGTVPPAPICAVVASGKAHQTSDVSQPVGAVVADKSLCASNTVYSFTANGETVLVCTNAAAPAGQPQQGDACDAAGLSGKMLPGYGGALTCIADQGQPCKTNSGSPGTTDGQGNCVASSSAPSPGSPCALPDGKTGLIGKDLPHECVVVGAACKDGTIDSQGACVPTHTLSRGSACTTSAGHPGVIDADGACVFVEPPKEGDDCTTDGGFAGKLDAALRCVYVVPPKPGDACEVDGAAGVVDANGVCVVTVAPAGASSSSSVWPWLLLAAGIGGAIWYTTSKKRSKKVDSE